MAALSRPRILACLTLSVLATLLVPAVAMAYHSDGRETTLGATYACIDCHGDDRDAWTGEGPHGYYKATTRKCRMCHRVHRGPSGGLAMLPGKTFSQTCLLCHDGTGGVGVYSAITARGGVVLGQHRIDTTTTVPGGSVPLTKKLECNSCHTVHRATVMLPFVSDAHKAMYHGFAGYSNRALRDDVGGKAPGTYTQYGSEWCGGCHDRRLTTSLSHDHPVESTMSVITTPYVYDNLVTMEGTSLLTTLIGPLGFSNLGYVMPVPRAVAQIGHYPICQQCHEDARNVGRVGAVADFEVALKDYGVSPFPVNPMFLNFPHQTTNVGMLVENNDDLCYNCHLPP